MARPIRDIPWLEQRNNGWYYAHWYDPEKRQTFRESLKTQDAAVAATRFGEFLLGGPGRRARRDAGLTVSNALDDYLRQHVDALDDKGRKLVVADVRQKIAVRHLKAYFGDRMMKDVGPAECRGYLEARRAGRIGGWRAIKRKSGNRASDSTVRRELAVLGSAARHAVKWGAMTLADMPRIELPQVSADSKVKWFTKEQLNAILAEALEYNADLYAFIKIAYYTGARRASIENLTKFQVDLKAGTIALQPEGGRVTKKRRPVVPIYPEIRSVVEHLMERPGAALFDRKFYDLFVEVCAKVGIDGHPHMLRHSRASHMLQDGEPIFKVAKLLGDTVATVERVYGHCAPEHLMTESGLSQSN